MRISGTESRPFRNGENRVKTTENHTNQITDKFTAMKRLIPALLLGILFPGPALTARNRQDADRALTDRVAKWQIEHFDTVSFPLGHWTNAALYRGMAEWAARTNADFIYDFLREIGRKSDWDMPPRIYDADDLCVGLSLIHI